MTQGASYILVATTLKVEGVDPNLSKSSIKAIMGEPSTPPKLRALFLMALDVLNGTPNEFLKDAMMGVDDPNPLYQSFYDKPLSYFADHIVAAVAHEVDEERFNGFVKEVTDFLGQTHA